MIGMNHNYPEASYEERAEIIKAHKDYTQGLLYFYKTDPRVPQELETKYRHGVIPKTNIPRTTIGRLNYISEKAAE